jgi:hypothetical protein
MKIHISSRFELTYFIKEFVICFVRVAHLAIYISHVKFPITLEKSVLSA